MESRLNFLLKYGTASFLKEMSFEEKQDLLDKILSAKPSKEVWNELCEFFLNLKTQEEHHKIVLLNKALYQLEYWNNDLRHVYSTSSFLNQDSIYSKLVRAISIYKREASGNEHLIAIAGNKNLTHLDSLVIDDSVIYASGFKALAQSQTLNNINSLVLKNISITKEEKEVLFSAEFKNLQKVTLQKVGLTDDHTQMLLDSKLLGKVNYLNVSFNNLGDEFVNLSFNSNLIDKINELILNENYISDTGAEIIVKNKNAANISFLDISKNQLTKKGKDELEKVIFSRKLKITL